MRIEEKNFILEYKELSNKFDLYLPHIKNAKNPEKRSEEFKLYGHDMSLESCFRKIINNGIVKSSEVLTLKEYMKIFKEQVEILKEITNAG